MATAEALVKIALELRGIRKALNLLLTEQRDAREVEEVAEKRAKAARKRWQSSDDANCMQSAVQDACKVQIKTDDFAMQRREEKKRADETAAADFDAWYSGYPKKVAKGAAKKAFEAARQKVDLETLTKGRDAYVKAVKDADKKFIKNPATWLNGECWDDEYEVKAEEVSQWDLIQKWNTQR